MTKFAFLALAALLAAPALSDDHDEPHADVEILPGWRTESGTHMAALRVTLDDGWKTYWRAPGEAGLPPDFDWSGSKNIAGVTAHWPVPEVFLSSGIKTLGFHHELVLPLEIEPVDPEADIALSGDLAMGLCDNICMPIQTRVSADLAHADTTPDPRIALALDRRPDTAEEAGLVSARCEVTPISDGMRVTARLEMPAPGGEEMTVMEAADRSIWVSPATTQREDGMLTAVADLVPPTAEPFELDLQSLRFTVLANGRGVDIHGCEAAR